MSAAFCGKRAAAAPVLAPEALHQSDGSEHRPLELRQAGIRIRRSGEVLATEFHWLRKSIS
jgi:hypothetical protein